MINKYVLGQRINNGGIIFSIISPRAFISAQCKTDEEFLERLDNHYWNEKHPGWKREPIYYVSYSEPQPVLTWDEFKEQATHIKDDKLFEEYEKIRKRSSLAIPECAIELEEDTDELIDKLFYGEEDEDI